MAYDKKSWTEFRETGLFHFVNSFLHLFGWAIVLSEEDDGSTEVFPHARTTVGSLRKATTLHTTV